MKTAQIPHEGYPLQWPLGRPRRESHRRETGAFQVSFARARDHLTNELRLWRARNVVVCSNVALRRDGMPYANERAPEDPGVAVYFEHRGSVRCVACDKYRKVEHNLRAVGLTIESLRAIERAGGVESLDQAYEGFKALPAQATTPVERTWWEVMGVTAYASTDDVRTVYRRLAFERHPDRNNGDHARWSDLEAAYRAFKRERGL